MFVLPLARPASLARRDSHSLALDRAVDRLFDESLDRFFGGNAVNARSRTPAMDVAESDAAFTVAFDVPGIAREQLKVSVEGRRVALTTVAAAAPAQAKAEPDAGSAASPAPAVAAPAERTLYRERSAAVYARTVSLPAEVDATASQARFENGVLTLVLAKKVAAGSSELRIA